MSGASSRFFAVFVHQFCKTSTVDREASLCCNFFGELNRKAIGRKKIEGVLATNCRYRMYRVLVDNFFTVFHFCGRVDLELEFMKLFKAFLERFTKLLFLGRYGSGNVCS